jgi:dihydroorotate dehydrogenase electron transfer subunit
LAHQFLGQEGRFRTEMILGVPDGSWEKVVDYTRGLVPELKVTSDDGSLGVKGNALSALPPDPEEVWACGPKAMLAGLVSRLPARTRVLVSLEARMGCGYGGCYGCAVPVKEGVIRVCTEGPVLEGREVRWDELA